MKHPDRNNVTTLEELPNIGKAIAAHLHAIGIHTPQDLIGKDPFGLYEQLCIKKEKRFDPCMIDVFMSVVEFMDGSDPRPWWSFTPKRKQLLDEKCSIRPEI